FCFLVSLLLMVVWAAPQKDHDHSEDHHQHLHHGKDEPHPSHEGKLSTHPEAKGKNIFFSPLSISMALSMLALGAKGNTHSQIFSTLGYSTLTPDQVNEGYEHLFHMLGHSQEAMQLEAGSALAVHEGFKPVDKFLKDAQHFYEGEAFTVDYSKPEVAVQEINKYIAKKTKDMITDMVKTLDPQTVMMLINYIYFRGKLEDPFEVSLTHEFDFYVNENTKVTVDMMERTDQFDFYHMEELEKQISRDHFKNWEEKLFVTLFKISAFISLQETLQEMGMVEAFSGAADFSGLSEDNKLMLSKVLHQAVLKVNEEGTEADAALIVELRLLSGWLSEIMVLNRPFLVFILDSSTRSILFMGKVNNPTE
uniref:Serpin domain-containing protein n=1 Tax=Astyanax mexicanus TaxID=7994 RepID=A0A3B1JPG6_ASTMX